MEEFKPTHLDGSGQRAMAENQRALNQVLVQIKALEERGRNGEDVFAEMRKLINLRERFLEDQGRIRAGGM